MRGLLSEILRRIHANQRVILCAVVNTRGSCPQKAGAAMAVFEDANTLGTLGGGCVEAEVRRRALENRNGTSGRVMEFRLNQDYGWDDGLVCGGIMEIIAMPIARDLNLKMIEQAMDDLVLNRPGEIRLDGVDESNQSRSFTIELPARPKLILAGAGHVGHAVSKLAQDVDFDVTVIDDRADMLNNTRFPNAKCVLGEIPDVLRRFCSNAGVTDYSGGTGVSPVFGAHKNSIQVPDSTTGVPPVPPEKSISIDTNTFVVIVTRGHRHDGEALHAVVNSRARYIGLIGSQRKIREIARLLFQTGVSRDALARVHAPIGLEIGAVTPNEIAISIMAELISIRRKVTENVGQPMRVPTDRLDRWLARV